MIPPQALIVPLFREFQVAHLINTYWALMLPQVPAPIAVFIFKKFLDGVPISLEPAAEVDRAGWWRAWTAPASNNRPHIRVWPGNDCAWHSLRPLIGLKASSSELTVIKIFWWLVGLLTRSRGCQSSR